MGPPRRNGARKLSVQYSSDSSAPPQSPTFHRQTTPATSKPPATNHLMTPSTRHQHNLKVLRRRDPSIISVFDQFSHVAVYRFLDGKWERDGFEGTMFLYERDSYPPYGYYILNRVGMEDYIGRLYPEDFLQKVGSSIAAIQSFPEFTERRLSAIRASAHPHELNHKFSDVFAIPNVENLTSAEKGRVVTIGLWTLDQVAREPLFEVLQRLHSYIRRHLPYPEEFQYGPERLPFPSSSPASFPPNGASLNGFSVPNPPANGDKPADSSMSELDKLFSKLAPTPSLADSGATGPAGNTKVTVESLFASMSGSESASDHNPSSASPPTSFRSSASPAPATGISLLDSIFASANTNGQSPPPNQISSVSTIFTPTPSSNSIPQVLSQEVISHLMGLPPSRTASTVSFTSSALSQPSSREGYADNEDESDNGTGGRFSEFEDGISESSTVLDSGAEEVQESTPSARQFMPVNFGSGSNHTNPGLAGPGRVQGDVTPRPPIPGFGGSAQTRPTTSRSSTVTSLPPSIKPTGSTSIAINGLRCPPEPHVQQHKPQHISSQQATPRRLVPFEPDSELWPYSRNHMYSSAQDAHANQQDSSDEIIELDFNDTSALSDPEAFNKVSRNGRTNQHLRNGSSSSGAAAPANGNGNGKVKEKPNRRKSKKERAAEQARIRQEIENSWDSPVPVGGASGSFQVGASGAARSVRADNDKDTAFPEIPSPATPSPCPSPVLGPVMSPRAVITPLSLVGNRGGADSRGSPAGQGVHHHPSAVDLRKKIAAINGHTHTVVHEQAPKEHKEVVRESTVAAVLSKEAKRPALEKNEFVREVLTLIHTDKSFVDTLYREYTSRL